MYIRHQIPMNLKYRSSDRSCSSNKFSEKLRNIHRKIPVLESLFNKISGVKACNFTKKRLQHRRFPVNIAIFKSTNFENHPQMTASDSGYILHRKLNKIDQKPDWSFVSFET